MLSGEGGIVESNRAAGMAAKEDVRILSAKFDIEKLFIFITKDDLSHASTPYSFTSVETVFLREETLMKTTMAIPSRAAQIDQKNTTSLNGGKAFTSVPSGCRSLKGHIARRQPNMMPKIAESVMFRNFDKSQDKKRENITTPRIIPVPKSRQ